jgi:DNA-binding transcriptional MerR regulator
MRVNQLANETGVSVDTVRYYTRIGFLKPTKNPSNGYKEYCAKEKRRMRFILSARQLGFSVSDIAEILDTADQGESPVLSPGGLYRSVWRKTRKASKIVSDYGNVCTPQSGIGKQNRTGRQQAT